MLKELKYLINMWGCFLAGLLSEHPVTVIIFMLFSAFNGILMLNMKEVNNGNS